MNTRRLIGPLGRSSAKTTSSLRTSHQIAALQWVEVGEGWFGVTVRAWHRRVRRVCCAPV